MHPRVAELVEYLDLQRAALLAAAAPVPTDRWTVRPAEDRWSISDVCEHLHLVERGTAKLIAAAADAARAANHAAETGTASVLGVLDWTSLDDRTDRRIAPERVAPRQTPDAATALRQLEESRAALRSAIERADGLALETVRKQHPRLGEIDLYQWMVFVGRHESRHAAQVVEIASAVAAP